ncbi:MAG TPA: hypothetical protein VGT78_10610 [Rhizomicrobium sp.]|nr:hypothetical protein [Rhizomicrobium sp.]
MSELIQKNDNRATIRRKLLTGVSALALTVTVSSTALANADDADRPQIWVELGGQFDQFSGPGSPFAPLFVVNSDWKGNGLISPTVQQKMNIFSLGEEGTISFQPEGSDWIFSGALRIGRSGGHKFTHQQLKGQQFKDKLGTKYITNTADPRYAQTKADSDEKHLIADFQAGKDVGLGLFGSEGTSVVSAGVRFAQFTAKSSATIHAMPHVHFIPKTFTNGNFKLYETEHHRYFGSGQRAASFQGVGPSISWDASAAVAGNPESGEITLDWGANAAILFGRQKAKFHHHTTGYYNKAKYGTSITAPVTATGSRVRSVVVPNLGGFAGLSLRWTNAKLSLGYRGDFFLGAIDTGFDSRKSTTRGFYGPFASISVGIP